MRCQLRHVAGSAGLAVAFGDMTSSIARPPHAGLSRTKIAARMSNLRARRHTARRFAWLLWLGLLLPVAQLAAATHSLSHARLASSRDEPGPQAPHLVHCDLCLAAAAIGGAALAADVPMLVPSPFDASPPRAVVHEPRATAALLAYRSRAPPVVAS
jgi:hypothetical protein